jgi:hypothetical protein
MGLPLLSTNFRYQPIAESLLPLKLTEPVSSGKCGKINSYKSEWAFRYQYFAAEALWMRISHIS